MEITDVWDDTPGSQRLGARYHARWKVMLVFANDTNKPTYQTLIHDLSLTGISVQYHSEVADHTILTLLLSLPPKDAFPRMVIKLQAEVTSSKPYRAGFRLGMKFIQDAGLDELRQRLNSFVVSEDNLYSDPEAEEYPILNL